MAVRLSGAVDRPALLAACRDVLARHDPLRTVYAERDGEPVGLLLSTMRAARSAVIEEAVPAALGQWVDETARRGFDVRVDPPVRMVLGTASPAESVLVIVVHPLAADAQSLTPLTLDLAHAYAARRTGRAPEWQPLPLRYEDFALRQRESLGSCGDPDSVMGRQAAFWREELAGIPAELALPRDRRWSAGTVGGGAVCRFEIGAELYREVTALAADNGVTVFTVLQAALAVTLQGFGAGDDIPLGTPVTDRGGGPSDSLVGPFGNMVVLRTDLSGHPSFRRLLRRAQESGRAARANRDIPIEAVVRALNPTRAPQQHPLFQVMLTLDEQPAPEPEFPGLNVTVEKLHLDPAGLDLSYSFTERTSGRGGMTGELTYAEHLFDAETAQRLTGGLLQVLTAVTADPSAPVTSIEVVSAADRVMLLEERNATHTESGGGVLPALLARAAGRHPDRAALVLGGRTYSYADIDTRSNRLARHLVSQGIGPEDRVAIALPRSEQLIVALLAVLKAGAAYLPLDLGHPPARTAHLLQDSRPVALLTDRSTRATLPATAIPVYLADAALEGYSPEPLTAADRNGPLRPEHPAYVIYTSGTTGPPKGTVIEHRAVVNFVAATNAAYALDERTRLLGFAAITFDVSVLEIFCALTSGATLVMADDEQRTDPRMLQALLREERVTVAELPPVMLPMLTPGELPDLRLVSVGGEAPAGRLVGEWASPTRQFWNAYGPTEATVGVTLMHCLPPVAHGSPPIGLPMPNTRAYVLDDALRVLPPGATGELYLAGVQLARGYLGRAGLTARHFVPDPFGEPGERMYRTGDLVRWNNNGQLVHEGRRDSQLKVRGFRIEAGEVENELLAQPGVAEAVVLTAQDRPGVARLTAYVVPDGEPASAGAADLPGGGARAQLPARLRRALRGRLPDYMVPSTVLVLDVLPRTANGKLDRRALPAPGRASGRAPRTAREQVLASVFAQVLGVGSVGIDDDFFGLGGDSLAAVRLASRIEAVSGVRPAVQDLFAAPTVAALVGVLRGGAGATPRRGG